MIEQNKLIDNQVAETDVTSSTLNPGYRWDDLEVSEKASAMNIKVSWRYKMKLKYLWVLVGVSGLLVSGCLAKQEATAQRGQKQQVDQSIVDHESNQDRLTSFVAESSSLMLQGKGNQLYAPIGPYLLLSLLSEGAVGETQVELFKAINQTPISRKSLHQFNEELVGKYLGAGDIKMANGLWLDEPVKLTSGFQALVEEHYFGDIKHVPFTEKPQEAASKIDQWTAKNLGQEFYDLSLVEPGFALVLLSTANFELEWEHTFDQKLTKEAAFYSEGQTIKTAMMHQSYDRYSYAATKDYLATSLPLKNGNRLQLILPNEGIEARSLIDSKEKLLSLFWIVEDQELRLNFSIPKFSFTNELDLQPNLEKIGLGRAFSEKEAGFSRLSSNVSLFLGRAIQKNQLILEEKQVTMAGYTQVMLPVNPENGEQPPEVAPVVVEEPVIEFNLDRPFIYLISDKDGIPLLQGIMDDPSQIN